MVDILFATNRPTVQGNPNAPFGSADTSSPLSVGVATVANVDLDDPDSGTITNIARLVQGSFTPAHLSPILGSGNDVLVFVHGAANSFADAITRAAYNQAWLSGSGLPNSTFDVIAFTWPSRSYHYANILGDLVDYRLDQSAATASATQFSGFLNAIAALRGEIDQLTQPGQRRRRMHLLCHSMGNYVLGGGLQTVLANKIFDQPVFDEIILAAPDEHATTFNKKGQRLAGLTDLGREITIYYNNDDIAMDLSHLVNGEHRLGYDGPANKADTDLFPPSVFEFVDCTGVNDYVQGTDLFDRSHQYYRQSQRVRADIAQTLAGFTPSRPKFDPAQNVYWLFPERLHAPDRTV